MPSQRHGNAVHFFKIILQSTLQQGELSIPRRFVRKYWKGLSNPVVLSLPNGDEWKVKWIERDGDVWFTDGWKKFADYYKIVYGHLLMFRYELGIRSHFQVFIFDKSASEIDYPASVRNIVHIDDDDDDCEEVKLEEESGDDGKSDERAVRSSPSMQPRKKMKINFPNEEPTGFFKPRDGTDQRAKHHENTRGCNGTRKWSKDDEVTEGKGSILEDTKHSRALERARRFHSEYPFFIRTMTSSYAYGSPLVIPCDFSREYLKDVNGTAKIRISGKERSWDVKCRFSVGSNKRVILSNGWRSFAEDNQLEDGDVCVFEMIHRHATTQVSFNAVIFRATLQESIPPITKHSEIMEASSKFDESENCFKIVMKDSHTTKYVGPYIPKEFQKRHMRCHRNDVRLQFGEKSWAMKVVCYSNFGKFSAGWPKFARECKLKEGDVCFFELIDDQNLVLKVSISRHYLSWQFPLETSQLCSHFH